MARMPDARWLGEHAPVQSNGQRKTMARYDVVCVHTIVGFAPAHAAHFSTHHDGRIDQSRDTRYQSGANLEGNPRVIAIENEDHGPAYGSWNVNDGHAVPAFTDEQIEAIARICAWAHQTHGIPLEPCPDSKPDSRGIAYHRQGIDGNWSGYAFGGRVPGGEVWTKSTGKVCPGDRRIAQIPKIVARAREIVEGDDVSAAEVWEHELEDPSDGKMKPAGSMVRYGFSKIKQTQAQIGALQGVVAQLVANQGSGTSLTLAEIASAAKTGAEAAMAEGIDVNVNVNVHDQEPAP